MVVDREFLVSFLKANVCSGVVFRWVIVFGCLAVLVSCQTSNNAGVRTNNVASVPGPQSPVVPDRTEPLPRIGNASQRASIPKPTITAKAAILVDQRGRVLFEKNADLRLPTASTQKLLLGILIADSGNLDKPITVSASDTQCEPTKIGLQAGQSFRKRDLLKAVLVRSSNDIARCLARDHSGSVSAFAKTMNYKARQLGMHDSYFTNASGLPRPAGQYSTARDLAILGSAAMLRPDIREAVATKVMTFRFPNGTNKTIYNTNEVLKSNPYCTGCKTGYTKAAGRCLVSSAKDGRNSVIAVILGSKTPDVWRESDMLLRYGLTVIGNP